MKQFWCPIDGCNRSERYPGQKHPFPRKDKRDVHVKKVHKVPGRQRKAFRDDPDYTTGDCTLFNQCGSDGPTAFGIYEAIGLPLMDAVTDAAGRTGAARPPEPVGEPIGMSNLAGLHGYTGSFGANDPTRLLGSTSLYGRSALFSTVDTANGADAAYLVGCAESIGGGGLAGFPHGEGPNWLPDNSDTAGITSFSGLSSADGLTGLGGLTNVDGLTSVDGFIAVDGTDVSGCTTVGAFATDDAFDWFASGTMFDEFGNVDTLLALMILKPRDSAI